MTTSSQTPPGALPPEAPQATAEEAPAVTAVQAATGVIRAAMDRGSFTHRELAQAEDLAQAEEDAGLLFDPQRAEDIARAAIEQARGEYEAKLDELRDEDAGAYFKLRYDRLQQLLAGHPTTHLMTVAEILAAVDGEDARAGAPLVAQWNGTVMGPSGDPLGEKTLVPCTTMLGGPAALVLTTRQRTKLGQQLLAVRDEQEPDQAPDISDIHAACPTDGCGTVDDYDASDPALFGWSRLEIASLGDGARWYCSDKCVIDALTRAGHELAAADRQDEQGGDL